MNDDHDPVMRRALQQIPVPEHGPRFWDELEARIAAEAPPVREHQHAATGDDEEAGGSEPDRPDEDLPVVVALADRRPPPRRALRLLSVAAVAAVVLAGAVTLNRRADAPERVTAAGQDPSGSAATTSPSTATVPAGPTADEAVVAWIEALGAGDIDAAKRRTGPRSIAYVNALNGGAGVEGILREAGEGYGAWAASPDRRTSQVELESSGGEEVTVVIVSGTWTGEGGTDFRTDAIPVVRTDGGPWLVEPWAIDPATGGRIEMLSPAPGAERGFDGLPPDGTLTAAAPGRAGTFHFSVDDAPATAVPARPSGSGVQATFDPPGDLASRTHLFLVVYVDGQTISTLASTFLVEG